MSSLPVTKQIVIDVLIFFALCIPITLVHFLSEPIQVGFFCSDQSLTLPYKPDTITQALLLIASLGGAFLAIAVTECLRVAVRARQSQRVRTALLVCAKAFGLYLFGFILVVIFTDSIKYSFGRLRPHFLDLCKPDFTKFNCTDEQGIAKYIQNYTCTNTMVDEKLMKDSHMSFPSGHAAVSFYSAVYVVLFLQLRMHVIASHFLRPVLQALCLLLAILCCVTRVTDHKHHATDILAGGLLGAVVAALLFFKLAWNLIPCPETTDAPRLPRATSIESEPQTPTPLLRPERLDIERCYRNGAVPMLRDDFLNKV